MLFMWPVQPHEHHCPRKCYLEVHSQSQPLDSNHSVSVHVPSQCVHNLTLSGTLKLFDSPTQGKNSPQTDRHPETLSNCAEGLNSPKQASPVT